MREQKDPFCRHIWPALEHVITGYGVLHKGEFCRLTVAIAGSPKPGRARKGPEGIFSESCAHKERRERGVKGHSHMKRDRTRNKTFKLMNVKPVQSTVIVYQEPLLETNKKEKREKKFL